MKFFAKEHPQKRFFFSDGKPLTFDAVSPGLGIVAVDEAKEEAHAKELDVVKGKHGIRSLTPELYEELKKKLGDLPKPPPAQGRSTLKLAPNSAGSISQKLYGALRPDAPAVAEPVGAPPAALVTAASVEAPAPSEAPAPEPAPETKPFQPRTARFKK